MMKVNLEDILESIEMASDAFSYYYHLDSGKVVMYADPLITGIEDKELTEDLENNFDRYLCLPTKFEVNQYHIMETFASNFPEEQYRNQLLRCIQGRGAFRRFKDTIYDLNLEKKWFDYEAIAYDKIARTWCKDNGLEILEKGGD